MSKNRSASGNKKKKRVLVCLYCKHVYTARGYKKCPKCGRLHHTSQSAHFLASAGLRRNYERDFT